MAEPLHMVRVEVFTGNLIQHGRRRHLPVWDVDYGYLLHVLLREAFGDLAPQPFAIQGGRAPIAGEDDPAPRRPPRSLGVLGYAAVPAQALREHADRFADPAVHAAVDWDSLGSKPMPLSWGAGLRLGFEMRACPVVRVGRSHPVFEPGAEVDVYQAEASRRVKGEVPSREPVYLAWLSRQVGEREGVSLVHAEVERFQIDRVLRRTNGEDRRSSSGKRPDVTFRGEIEVLEGDAFADLLRRGVGRHRAFGFGMLLLRPVAAR